MLSNYKNIRPLVIGLGVAGKRHLEAQLNLGIKTGIYTTNPQTIKYLRDNRNVTIFNNLEEGLDWSNLVHVCTPDDKHTEYVAAAVKKRKVVLCEKAFTTSLKDAIYLQKLAHKYKATVIVGQNYRLTPSFAKTRKMIKQGALGKINKVEITYLHDKNEYQKRKTLRKNEDFLYIGGSHAVDLACWVIGEPIINIKATSKNNLSYEITLEFASAIYTNIILDASSAQTISGTDLKVYGDKGKLASHNKKNELLFYTDKDKKHKSIKLPNSQTLTTRIEVSIIDDYLSGKIKSFWPLPEVNEAAHIIKILDAIHKSTSFNQEISL